MKSSHLHSCPFPSAACPFPAPTASLPRGGTALSSQRSQWSARLRPCWRERKTTQPQLIPSIFFSLQHSSLLTSIISLTTPRSPSMAFSLHVIEDFTLSHHGIPPIPMVLSAWPQDTPPPPGMSLEHLMLKVHQLHSSSPILLVLCRVPEIGPWEFL